MSSQEQRPGIIDSAVPDRFQARLISADVGKEKSIGMTVIIVGLDPRKNGDNITDPLIWTILEKQDKPETSKVAGQLSVPAETRKDGESLDENLLGALAEFMNDEAFSYVSRHLKRMGDVSTKEAEITYAGKPIDVMVLIYDGAMDFPFKPVCDDEVSPNGWVARSALLADEGLREPVRQVLELDMSEGFIARNLEAYYANPDAARSVFPDDVTSIADYFAERERRYDDVKLHYGWKQIEQMIPERRERMSALFSFLSESQKLPWWKRNYRKEQKAVADFWRDVHLQWVGGHQVGIDQVSGDNVRIVGEPKGGFRSWGDSRKTFPPHRDTSLRTAQEHSILGNGFWELQRGDELGYPKELGKEWYLLFQLGKSGDYEHAIVPVKGIKDLRLKPFYAQWDM